MAYTQTDLDTLDLAIAAGQLSMRIDGREVTFANFDDLMRRRAFVAAQLSGATSSRPRHSVARFDDD
jgi:hypothetical protein